MVKKHVFQAQEVAEYEKKRYRNWDQRLVDRREKKILQTYLSKIESHCPLLLDLPCGYGRFISLSLTWGYKVVAADLSPAMVARALQRGRVEGVTEGVVLDALLGLPFKDESFGLILAMRFFHHLHQEEERKMVLHEFWRVAQKDMLLSFYQENFFHRAQRRLRRWIKRSPTQIKMISWGKFHREVSEMGWAVVEKKALFPGIHSQIIVWLKKSKPES